MSLPNPNVYTFRQMDLKTYLNAWESFKSSVSKCLNLDIPKQAQLYLLYNGLNPEFCNMVDALLGSSVMTLEINNAFNLYERIAKNQANLLINKEIPKKAVRIHNVDKVTTLASQIGALIKSLTFKLNLCTWYSIRL